MIGGITMLMEPAADKVCLACGYDLRAGTGDRCPECGGWFDVTGELTPTLPWAHRRRVGRVRGYLKTVWMLSREPGRLGEELVRVVDLTGARRFRRITVVLLFLSLATTAFFIRRIWAQSANDINAITRAMPSTEHDQLGDFVALLVWNWSFWISLLALLLILIAMMAAVGWFMQTRKMDVVRWNRATALACYTCAPLALMPIALGISWGLYFLVGWLISEWVEPWDWHWQVLVSVAPAAVIVLWFTVILRLVKRTTECGMIRLVTVAVALPVIWTVVAMLIFVAVHAVSMYLFLLCRGL